MTRSGWRRAVHPAVVLVPLVAVALCACGHVTGASSGGPTSSYAVPPGAAPGEPSAGTGFSGGTPGITSGPAIATPPAESDRALDDANLLTPVADLDNVRATAWQRVTGTGRDLVVQWASTGLAPCSLLSRVDVAETASTVTVTVHTGESPGVKCGVAPQVGLPMAARVTLDADRGARAVVDGAR